MNSPPLVSQPCLSVLEPGGFAPPPLGHLHLPTFQMLPEAVGAKVLLLPMGLKGKVLEAPHALNGFAVMNVLGPDTRALDLDPHPHPSSSESSRCRIPGDSCWNRTGKSARVQFTVL